MLKSVLQERKPMDGVKICHPHTKELVSFKVEEVAAALLAQCKKEENFSPRYGVCLGSLLISEQSLEKSLLSEDREEGMEYFLKIEKSIARALSSLLEINPPLEYLKDFGVCFKKIRRLDNDRVVMTYALEDDSAKDSSLDLTFLDSKADGVQPFQGNISSISRLQSLFDMQKIVSSLLEITGGSAKNALERSVPYQGQNQVFQDLSSCIDESSPMYEEVFYFANALFYGVEQDQILWTQRFLKALEETHSDTLLIPYLRNLLQPFSPIPFLSLKHSSPIPLEDIPSLLKGVFLLFAKKINPKNSQNGMNLQCAFPLGPYFSYVDIPVIEERDLEIQKKYLDKKSFIKITEILASKVSNIQAKYLAKENLSLEEFKWALQGADFKNGNTLFSPEEKIHVVNNIERYSSACFGPVLAEQIAALLSTVSIENPTKLVCGTIRRWIREHSHQLHEVTSDTWHLFTKTVLTTRNFSDNTKPWELLLLEITSSLSKLPNPGLADFLTMLLQKTQCTLDHKEFFRDLVWDDSAQEQSEDSLCKLYKNLYTIPKIAQAIERNYLFFRENLSLRLQEQEKLELQAAIKSRISSYFDQQKIPEAFILLNHRYTLLKDRRQAAKDLTGLFYKCMDLEEPRKLFFSSVQRYYPETVGQILENLKTSPLAEDLWISMLAQEESPAPFKLRKQCLLKLLDKKTANPPQALLESLCRGLSQEEALILLEECIARASKLPDAKIEMVFQLALSASPDLHSSFKAKTLDLVWLQSFFSLLQKTEMITEDRLEFLCSHFKNHSLLDAKTLIASIFPVCNEESKKVLVCCVQFQIEKMLSQVTNEQTCDLLFSYWSCLMQEPLFSVIFESGAVERENQLHFPYRATNVEEFRFLSGVLFQNKTMEKTLQECFTHIAENIAQFIRQKKGDAISQLQKYMTKASIQERSFLAENCIKKLVYCEAETLALLQMCMPSESLEGACIQEFIPYWKENSWQEAHFHRGLALFQGNRGLQEQFVEFVVGSMEGYPVVLLQKMAPFLNENARAILKDRIKSEIAYFNDNVEVSDSYLSLLENFIVFVTGPEFSDFLEPLDVYQSTLQMSQWLLRELKYNDRLNLFFRSLFRVSLQRREVPQQKRAEIDFLRLEGALDCAADLKLSKTKEALLIDSLCGCSEDVLKEISESSLRNMKLKSQNILLKALEKKCKNSLDLGNFPSEAVLSMIDEQLEDAIERLSDSEFNLNRDTFRSLSEIMKEIRLHQSERVGSCAGNLALLFLRNNPLKENLEIANALVCDVLQFRLYLGGKVNGFPLERFPEEVEDAFIHCPVNLQIDVANDLFMYFMFLQEIHCGINSRNVWRLASENHKVLNSNLEINSFLIRNWIEKYGKEDSTLGIQTELTQKITNILKEILESNAHPALCSSLGILALDLLLEGKKLAFSVEKLEFFFHYVLENSTFSVESSRLIELYQGFIDKWAYDDQAKALLGNKVQKILKLLVEKVNVEYSKIITEEEFKILYNSIALKCASYLHPSMRDRANMEYSLRLDLRKLIEYDADYLSSLIVRVKNLIKYQTAEPEVRNRYRSMIIEIFKNQLVAWTPVDMGGFDKKDRLLSLLENE